MSCPDANQVNAFVEGILSAQEASALEAHFDSCPECRQMIAALARGREQHEKEPTSTDLAGKRLEHYEIIKKLGRGGMGEVYSARDTKLGREVALKVLPAELAGDPERRARFEREARAAACLNHPHIVTLYSVEEDEGELFITMELVEGEPLSALIARHPKGLPIARVLELGIDLADALAEAHEHGVTHRDLKPANVVVASDGVLKVLDFGLARISRDSASAGPEESTDSALSVEGRILGTPAYMSPEQAGGKAVDHRTDIFSLGIVLYEMATGRRPFVGDSALSIISSVLKDTPPSLVEVRSELPARLAHIVERCLAKDVRKRYQSARDLASDLEEIRRESPKTHARPRRRARIIEVAIIAFGALAVFAMGRAWRADTTRPSAVNALKRQTFDPGVKIQPRISPDGTWLVYVAQANGVRHLFRQRVGGTVRTDLTPDSAKDEGQPAISPDGERIAFHSEREGGGIYVMGATGEAVRRVTDFGFHPAWSPSGKELLLSSVPVVNPSIRTSNSEAWVVDAESGARHRVEAGTDAIQGAWSPHDLRLAFAGILGTASNRVIFTVPRSGGSPRIVVDAGGRSVWGPAWSADGHYLYFSNSGGGTFSIERIQVDEATGEPKGELESVTRGVGSALYYPSLSRDGSRLAFASYAMSSNIERVPLDENGLAFGLPSSVTRGSGNFYTFPDPSPDGEHVVFCSDWGRPDVEENIYVARADGTDLRTLTNDVAKRNRLPRWTADGKSILFFSNRSGIWSVWTISPDGSGLRKLGAIPGRKTNWLIPAPTSSRAAVLGEPDLFILDLDQAIDGQQPQLLARYKGNEPGGFFPSDWSPDEQSLLGDVADKFATVYSLESQKYERIGPGKNPRWFPDGKHLVAVDPDGAGLSRYDPAGRERTPLLSLRPDAATTTAVSRDGHWLYYSRFVEDGDIWLMDL